MISKLIFKEDFAGYLKSSHFFSVCSLSHHQHAALLLGVLGLFDPEHNMKYPVPFQQCPRFLVKFWNRYFWSKIKLDFEHCLWTEVSKCSLLFSSFFFFFFASQVLQPSFKQPPGSLCSQEYQAPFSLRFALLHPTLHFSIYLRYFCRWFLELFVIIPFIIVMSVVH